MGLSEGVEVAEEDGMELGAGGSSMDGVRQVQEDLDEENCDNNFSETNASSFWTVEERVERLDFMFKTSERILSRIVVVVGISGVTVGGIGTVEGEDIVRMFLRISSWISDSRD